ncbi:hypothetical protein [Endozoicomonas ascidiicola]|uniref:hypothetical protein n=1 Tax=Endozoicomonas ascidiicola TaxID=1698521 RepID=UPI000831A0B3|nr:hypothetical protein [Endozoicomonas ascidiicola]
MIKRITVAFSLCHFRFIDSSLLRFVLPGFLALVMSGCGQVESSVVIDEIPLLSDNLVVQKAYERCVNNTHEELVRNAGFQDSSAMTDDVRAIMYSGVVQTCESAVVITCDKSLNTDSCNIILDIYKS